MKLYKLCAYYKINKHIILFIAPIVFLILILSVLSSGNELHDKNIGVVVYLFGPLVFICIFTKIFTLEYRWRFTEILSTYQESKLVIFFYKYVIGLLFFGAAILLGFLLCSLRNINQYNLTSLFYDTLAVAFAVGNIAVFIGIWLKSFEQSMISGLLLVLVIIKFALPEWFYIILCPVLAIASGCGAIWLFSQTKEGLTK